MKPPETDTTTATRQLHSEKRSAGPPGTSAGLAPRTSLDTTKRPGTAGRVYSRSKELPVHAPSINITSEPHTSEFPTSSPPHFSSSQNSPFDGTRTPIGVALGSPAHPPTWGRAYTSDNATPRLSANAARDRNHSLEALPQPPRSRDNLDADMAQRSRSPATNPPERELKKQKSSTWRGLFARKQTKASIPEPFYKLEQPRVSDKDHHARGGWSGEPTPKPSADPQTPWPARFHGHAHGHGHARDSSVSRGLLRSTMRAEMDKRHFDSMASPPVMSPISQKASVDEITPPPSRKGSVASGEDVVFDTETGFARGARGLPRLEVDIPVGEMERYSVMFEGLLKPRMSLLERRKGAGTLKKLNPLVESKNRVCSFSPFLFVS
ncbi:hypothetical protein M8818_007920 [Zalaria obscura]|uniref:Uncharacterized protein n=1 Tax=Zalaria obscura TaxID=2024903 RepID=A0ACC3S339_9PEZI